MTLIDQMNLGNQPVPAYPAADGQQPVEQGIGQMGPEGEVPAMESLDGKHRITANMFQSGEVGKAVETEQGSTLKRVLLGIFTFGIYTAVKHCSRHNLAHDVVNLKNQLKTFVPGERQLAVKIGGEEVLIHQREDDVLTVRIDGSWYKVAYNAGQLVDKLERDIVTHPQLYGRQAACEVLPDVALQTDADIDALFKTGENQNEGEAGSNVRLRALSLDVLSSQFGIDKDRTFSVTTKLLNHYAHQILLGNITSRQRLEEALDRVSDGAKFMTNSQSDLDVVLDYESAMRTNKALVAESVGLPGGRQDKLRIFTQDRATKQQLVHNFVADLVSSSRSWDTDLKDRPGETEKRTQGKCGRHCSAH